MLEASPSATAWHGACLTIAELSRRGELAQSQLQAAAPLIAKALQLDIRRGAHRLATGSHSLANNYCQAGVDDTDVGNISWIAG